MIYSLSLVSELFLVKVFFFFNAYTITLAKLFKSAVLPYQLRTDKHLVYVNRWNNKLMVLFFFIYFLKQSLTI